MQRFKPVLCRQTGALRRLALGVLLFTASCADPTEPPIKSELAKLRQPTSALALRMSPIRRKRPSEELADKIPSFGGAFIRDGVLNVYLANASETSLATGIVRAQLLERGASQLAIRFIPAQFTYRALRSYIAPLFAPSGSAKGVSDIWVDEWTNRLRIGVVSEEARSRVAVNVRRLGLPRGAVSIEDVPYFKPTAIKDLKDQISPLVGGIEVKVQDSRGQIGTMTAIVDVGGAKYALIASHVADSLGLGDTGGIVYQNRNGRRIGVVSINPAFSGTVPGCPNGLMCRESDAALVLLDANVAANLGDIARPLGGPTSLRGTTDIDDSNPIHLATDGEFCSSGSCSYALYPGSGGSKIGITTGWTGGAYEGQHYAMTGGDGLTRLSVHIFYGEDDKGDSGGPVLVDGSTTLFGLAYGAAITNGNPAFLVSPFEEIANELAGSVWNMHPIPPYMLGYEQHSLYAPCEPYDPYPDPDNFDMYLVKGYFQSSAGAYETRSTQYMGYTGYRCMGTLYFGTYQYNAIHQSCNIYFNAECPCAAETAGGYSCPVLPP